MVMKKSTVIQVALFVAAATVMFRAWSFLGPLRVLLGISLEFNRQLFMSIWNM